MTKVNFPKGGAYKIKGGKRVTVDAIDVPEYSDCCKLDCCENVIRLKDKCDGVDMVAYIFQRVMVVTTAAQYEIDKAADTFFPENGNEAGDCSAE